MSAASFRKAELLYKRPKFYICLSSYNLIGVEILILALPGAWGPQCSWQPITASGSKDASGFRISRSGFWISRLGFGISLLVSESWLISDGGVLVTDSGILVTDVSADPNRCPEAMKGPDCCIAA